MSSRSRQPANIPYSNFWLVAAEDAVRPRASENRKNYANAVGSKEKRSKRCIMTAREPRTYFAGLFFHSEHVVVGREVVHQDSYFLILHSERERALLRGSFAPMFLIFEAVYSSCSRSFSCTRNARISRGKSCGTS
jgi:hypothetical protein